MFSTTGQSITLTWTDAWTSIQNMTYMCVIAHWIDSEWTLNMLIIEFKQIEDHKGASIGASLDDCMKN